MIELISSWFWSCFLLVFQSFLKLYKFQAFSFCFKWKVLKFVVICAHLHLIQWKLVYECHVLIIQLLFNSRKFQNKHDLLFSFFSFPDEMLRLKTKVDVIMRKKRDFVKQREPFIYVALIIYDFGPMCNVFRDRKHKTKLIWDS